MLENDWEIWAEGGGGGVYASPSGDWGGREEGYKVGGGVVICFSEA